MWEKMRGYMWGRWCEWISKSQDVLSGKRCDAVEALYVRWWCVYGIVDPLLAGNNQVKTICRAYNHCYITQADNITKRI